MRPHITLLLLLAVASAATAADCPSTLCTFYRDHTTPSPLPSGTLGMDDPNYFYPSRTDVRWDAPLGTLSVTGSVTDIGFPNGSVATTDDFVLLGALAGTTVRITARLDGSGSNTSLGFRMAGFRGSLSDAAGHTVTAGPEPPNVLRLALPVDFVAGTPLRLTYRLEAWGSALPTSAEAALGFADLPADMTIVSCRGFQLGAVTATRKATWRRVKQLFR